MDASSPSLLDRLRRGGSASDWELFGSLYLPLVRRWAWFLTHSETETDDLVQEVFLQVMRSIRTFQGQGESTFLAWLKTLLRNRWLDQLRRASSRPEVLDPKLLHEHPARDALNELTTKEDRDFLIKQALRIMQSHFEERTWRACWETVVEDRSAADVAEELGVSIEVVYSASYRVIRRLRQELADAWR